MAIVVSVVWNLPTPTGRSVRVALTVPGVGQIVGVWRPTEAERLVAWDLLVELVTRSVVRPANDETLCEQLSSLEGIADMAGRIVRVYASDLAPGHSEGDLGLGVLILKVVIEPIHQVVSRYGAQPQDDQATGAEAMSAGDNKRGWVDAGQLYSDLTELRTLLRGFSAVLADGIDTDLHLGAP